MGWFKKTKAPERRTKRADPCAWSGICRYEDALAATRGQGNDDVTRFALRMLAETPARDEVELEVEAMFA